MSTGSDPVDKIGRLPGVDAMEAAEGAEDYAEIGRMVEESRSAEVCRVVAGLAVAEVWRGGVGAGGERRMQCGLRCWQAKQHCRQQGYH